MNVKGLVPLAALALAAGLGLPSLAQDNAADARPDNAMTKSAPAAAPAAVGKPDTHNGAWLETHGQAARVDEESCLQCHTGRTSCIQCHQDTQPRSHTPSWVKRGHALEARWSRETCLACHNDDSCIACHQSTPPSSHRPGWEPRSPASQAASTARAATTRSPTRPASPATRSLTPRARIPPPRLKAPPSAATELARRSLPPPFIIALPQESRT